MYATRMLPLDQIRLDGDTQVRLAMDQPTIDRYAELMLNDVKLPAVDVFYDGTDNWMAEGFHRYHAAEKNKQAAILATIHLGTKADAQYFALTANTTHGLPLTNADKVNAVKRALHLHPEYSDRRIADDLAVSHPFVAKQRVLSDSTGNGFQSKRVGKDGRETTPNPHNAASSSNSPKAKKVMTQEEYEAGDTSEPQSPAPGYEQEAPADDGQPAANGGMDCAGHVLPEHLVHAFGRREEIEKLMRTISQVKSVVMLAAENNDPLFSEANVVAVKSELTLVHQRLSSSRPYSICPYCTGDGCKSCKKRGWVTKATWEMAPPETRAQLEKK